jgi:hypothetical protein
MPFKLGDLIIDRISMAYAEKFDGTPLYVLTQLSDASIEISAESRDAVDKDGVLIKRFWNAKTGEFTATNAMINLNVLAAQSGNDANMAGTGTDAITMPRIITVKSGTTATLTGYVNGNRITVNALGTNGAMGKAYTAGSNASATEYKLDGTTFTPPTDSGEVQYVVKYDRSVTEGVEILNSADKFPATVKLTLKGLCVDPCEADTLRAVYIVLPSFQPSPETTIALNSDNPTLDFNGSLQVDYCSTDKTLYKIFYATADSEV